MRLPKFVATAALLALAWPISAQDLTSQEVVVTATRIDQDDYSDHMPAVGLRRQADFLVREYTIRGDTRDVELREKEIRAMLAKAVGLAGKHGVEMAYGSYILTRLTTDNIDDLDLMNDYRPDSERVNFLVKTPLAGRNVAEAQKTIDAFENAVPEVGRAQMDAMGNPTLSVVGPDSYRQQIIGMVAEDARKQAAQLGDGYAVELTGLNMPVQWARSGPDEVLLYIPYELKLVPKR